MCEATTRNGRLKTQRHGKGDLMLREDLASLEYISEDILVDHLRYVAAVWQILARSSYLRV